MALGSNIKRRRLELRWTLERLSEASGVDVGTINALENRDSARSKYVSTIARAMLLSSEELESGRWGGSWGGSAANPVLINPSEHPDFVEVPRVKFKLSAGISGFSVDVEQDNGKPIFFRRDWFQDKGFSPDKLFAVRVQGASMEPSLWDNDLVVINSSDTTPVDGEAFALNYEGELTIKRLRRDAGEWWATSDNADQRRFAPKRCTEEVKIIGRVVYKQSERI